MKIKFIQKIVDIIRGKRPKNQYYDLIIKQEKPNNIIDKINNIIYEADITRKAYKKYVKEIKNFKIEKIEFENCPNPKVSIIIPVYNQFEYTMTCLNSIKQNAGLDDYEIIITDDCSTDETRNIENLVSNINVIRNEQNLGFLKNCNKAVKKARGEYIYLLNNDTYVLNNAVSSLCKILDENKNAGAAGSKLIRPTGNLQEAGCYTDKNGYVFMVGCDDNPLRKEYNTPRKVDYCSGCSLMIRKNLWIKLNGFDEIYSPGYYEETDLCMRLKLKGYDILYCPDSEIIHYVSLSFSQKSTDLISLNRSKFYNKWKNELDNSETMQIKIQKSEI